MNALLWRVNASDRGGTHYSAAILANNENQARDFALALLVGSMRVVSVRELSRDDSMLDALLQANEEERFWVEIGTEERPNVSEL